MYILRLQVLIALFVSLVGGVQGQNLVRNQSFEEYKRCPKYEVTKKLKLKQNAIGVKETPRYFNTCNTEPNPFGEQKPFEGNAYCGLVITSDEANECNLREVIELKLSEPLIAGHKYKVSFQVNLADNSGYYSDQIGLIFSREKYKKDPIFANRLGRYDIRNPLGNFLKDTVNWTEISGIYNAEGGERYLIIGNFQACNSTTRKTLIPNNPENVLNNMKKHYKMAQSGNLTLRKVKQRAYYYVDYVSVNSLPLNDSISNLKPEEACLNSAPINQAKNLNLIADPRFDMNNNGSNPFWSSPSKGTPDFKQNGNKKFAGLYLHSPANKDNREYITSKLKQELSPCYNYYLQFDVKKSPVSQYEVDRIGIAFSDSAYTQNDRLLFPLKKQFETPKNLIINNTDEWITVCAELKPQMCANYIIVGNFSSDEETVVMPSNQMVTGAPWAYYLVDNFILTQTSKIENCTIKCDSVETKTAFEPEKNGQLKDSLSAYITFAKIDTITFHFASSQSLLDSSQNTILQNLIRTINKTSNYEIVIEGHADNTGNEPDNLKLSKKRADFIYNTLKSNGIKSSQIKVFYFGSKKPKSSNQSESGKADNRRVEVYLISKE